MARTKTIITERDAERMAEDFNFKWGHLTAIGLEVIACPGTRRIEVVYRLHHEHGIDGIRYGKARNILMTIQDTMRLVEMDAEKFENYEIDSSLDEQFDSYELDLSRYFD